MTPPSHQDATASPFRSPTQSVDLESSLNFPKLRRGSPAGSLASLPYRRSNPSLSSLFASTSSAPNTRPGSATPPTSTRATNVFSPLSPNGSPAPFIASQGRPDEPRNLILRAFVPHVGVLASADTEEMLVQKGFPGGLLELLRPFGEQVLGKVTIRDSIGSSRSWEDFGIRFTGLRDGLGIPRAAPTPRASVDGAQSESVSGLRTSRVSATAPLRRVGGDVEQVEDVVDKHLAYAELQPDDDAADYLTLKEKPKTNPAQNISTTSPFYSLYLRRLLSALPMTPHETFSHPVACIIAISSRNPSPIDELRRLYTSTNTGDYRLPHWVNNEFLRYYVLVHDEEHDDVAKSTALYEQMKRHFGLHCHLLRLRSSQCVSSDEDSMRLPTSQWISATEELAEITKRELSDEISDPTPHLFESDATALRTFIRELVTQSIIPTMERLCATWNEQVASRRRGLSGRLSSLTRKWTPFGSSSRSSSTSREPTTSSSGSNYDATQACYRPQAPEALMRKLADYAFMLRDFKLAAGTYELLRSDFAADKAWLHHAGANEFAALATLLNTQALTAKLRVESVDHWLETAGYSYLARCGNPFGALRTLVLGMELLRIRGAGAADDAARWAVRCLDQGLVGPVGEALLLERVGGCFEERRGVGSLGWGARRRKAAFYRVLAAESWVAMGRWRQAVKALAEGGRLYGIEGENGIPLMFEGMQGFIGGLKEAVRQGRREMGGFDEAEDEMMSGTVQDLPVEPVEEATETFDAKPRRKSMIGAATLEPPLKVGEQDEDGLEAAPLSPLEPTKQAAQFPDLGTGEKLDASS